jgi:hypothetical protein
MRNLTTPTPSLATVAVIKSKTSTIVQGIKSSPCNLVLDAVTNGSRGSPLGNKGVSGLGKGPVGLVKAVSIDLWAVG